MRRWTNGLPDAAARLGAKMALLRGLSASQCRMRADTHPGPEHQCSTPRSDTLLQLSRSPAQPSALRRTAGPYILAHDGHTELSQRPRQEFVGSADAPGRLSRLAHVGRVDGHLLRHWSCRIGCSRSLEEVHVKVFALVAGPFCPSLKVEPTNG